MDWIKKNPAQLTLAIMAVLAIAATVLLYTMVSAFDSNFEKARSTAISNAPVGKLNTDDLDAANKAIATPVTWDPKDDHGRLLVSKLYLIQDGKLLNPKGRSFNPPVPNAWLAKYGLDPLAKDVLSMDPMQKGFTVLEDWNGLDAVSHLDMNGQPVLGADGQPLPDDSTNPTKAESHPPYHTKLELAKVVYIPFRLKLMSVDVPARVTKPSDITVGINTLDLRGKTHFLPIGEDIPGTKYKIESYEKKEAPGADGTTRDVSEVTIINKETGAKVILPLLQVVDSPDSYAVFRYKWFTSRVPKTSDFSKRRNETFTLQPEPDKTYKLVEIKGQEVTLELPGGTKKTLTATP